MFSNVSVYAVGVRAINNQMYQVGTIHEENTSNFLHVRFMYHQSNPCVERDYTDLLSSCHTSRNESKLTSLAAPRRDEWQEKLDKVPTT